MYEENVIKSKSFEFALSIARLVKKIQHSHKEFVLSRQLLRSGTAIGALVSEAEQAESKKDFVHKMSIALKEANETKYWLKLLSSLDYLEGNTHEGLKKSNVELIKLLISIIKTAKLNLASK